MIETPEISETSDQLTAFIRCTIPRHEIATVMGPGISELMTTVAAQGIAVVGPCFSRHLRVDPEVFDFEISVPVSASVKAEGRVEPGMLRGARVARTVFHGSYEGLGPAWEEFDTWIAENGHQPGFDLLEIYVAGPESSPDPANWRTELNRPLVDVG